MVRASEVMRWSTLTLILVGLSCAQPGEGSSAADCGDGADNDANGLFDCDDPGCAASPLCTQLPLGDDDDSASAGCVPCSGTYDISSLADFTPILNCESIGGSLRIDALDASAFEFHHGGFSTADVNKDPHRAVPLDVLRTMEREGRIGKLFGDIYSFAGCSTYYETAARMGREIARDLKGRGVNAVLILSS